MTGCSQPPPLDEASDRRRTRQEERDLGPHAPRRILVVDDNPTAQRLLQLTIELEGATVEQAGSLSEARRRLGQTFDGVVLDRQLPDGDGLDLLSELAKEQPQAAIVVCSSLNARAERWSVCHVPKTDMDGVVGALGLGRTAAPAESEARRTSALESTVHWWIAGLGRRPATPPSSATLNELVKQLAPSLIEALEEDDEVKMSPLGSTQGRQGAEPMVRRLMNLREPLAGELARQLDRRSQAEVLVGVHRELDRRILREVEARQ